jgi:hypothetical protein
MKKTLWVFGDSFAAEARGWPTILASLLGYDSIQCHGVMGSSLYYSYRLLLEKLPQISNQDKVVFFITNSARLYTSPKVTRELELVDFDCHLPIAGPDAVAVYRGWVKTSQKITPSARAFLENFLDAIEKYYIYLQDPGFTEFIHKKIIEDLEKIKSTTILTSNDIFDCPLSDLVNYCNQWVMAESPETFFLRYEELDHMLLNHLSMENNVLIAKHIYNIFVSGAATKLSKQDLIQLKAKDLSTHFKSRSS